MDRRFNGEAARVAADFMKASLGLRRIDASQRS
jgi:hypothetical protein